MNKILELRNLHIHFRQHHQIVRAVEGVNLDIYEREILALVGESGSGKTVTALSITGLLPENAQITSGEIIFQEQDLLKINQKTLEALRGKEISYIFQEAAASLNPVLTIGRQIQETVMLHQDLNKQEAYDLGLELLQSVGLLKPQNILKSYPHQLSGGMNQRVMIAMSLSSGPRLLIADEPTTALDVTVEAEVIRMLLELKKKMEFSILFITHNLALVKEFASRIAIMYKGKIVEEATTEDIFSSPGHPHTRELISSIIRL